MAAQEASPAVRHRLGGRRPRRAGPPRQEAPASRRGRCVRPGIAGVGALILERGEGRRGKMLGSGRGKYEANKSKGV